MKKERIEKIISVLFALLVWQIACMAVGNELLLASPLNVVRTLFGIIKEPDFWKTTAGSSLRIIEGFLAAFAAGLILGAAASRYSAVRVLLKPFMVTIRSVPVASFIILSLIWMNSRQLASFVCFAACLPLVCSNVLEGLTNVDISQKEAAQILGAGWLKTVRSIMIPNIGPYLLSAASTGCGTAFKAGVAAEVVAVVSGSIGEQIYMSKIYFETARLFAWTLVIVLLSFAFEKLFCLILKKMLRL